MMSCLQVVGIRVLTSLCHSILRCQPTRTDDAPCCRAVLSRNLDNKHPTLLEHASNHTLVPSPSSPLPIPNGNSVAHPESTSPFSGTILLAVIISIPIMDTERFPNAEDLSAHMHDELPIVYPHGDVVTAARVEARVGDIVVNVESLETLHEGLPPRGMLTITRHRDCTFIRQVVRDEFRSFAMSMVIEPGPGVGDAVVTITKRAGAETVEIWHSHIAPEDVPDDMVHGEYFIVAFRDDRTRYTLVFTAHYAVAR
ncbi:hypothetical protein F5Y18DRAFT_52148 [Xylariaceae sp. FL1019]|nr:hypothetical protein F5Y18DRAFT_52148 [Xylariaceae sp. FL1019]